jgi:Pyruvate/2-oxoacid:ferredoxin oxidoreductase delta subunit
MKKTPKTRRLSRVFRLEFSSRIGYGILEAVIDTVMDPKLFKQRLDELAEWRYLKGDSPVSTAKRGRGRPRSKPKKSNEPTDLEFSEDLDHDTISTEPNQTLSIQIVKMRCQAQVCDDCGSHCPEGRRIEQKVYDHTNYPHWRKHCDACGLTQNPYTGKFDLKGYETHAVWTKYTRGRNSPKLKTKNNIVFEDPDQGVHYEDSEIRITFPRLMQKPA